MLTDLNKLGLAAIKAGSPTSEDTNPSVLLFSMKGTMGIFTLKSSVQSLKSRADNKSSDQTLRLRKFFSTFSCTTYSKAVFSLPRGSILVVCSLSGLNINYRIIFRLIILKCANNDFNFVLFIGSQYLIFVTVCRPKFLARPNKMKRYFSFGVSVSLPMLLVSL